MEYSGKCGVFFNFLWIAKFHKTQFQSGQNPKLINKSFMAALAAYLLSFGNLSSCQDKV